MISQIREPLSKLAQPVIIFFAKMGLHPTVYTVIGLLLSIAAGVFLGLDNYLTGFILIWVGGTMDFIDGGVARYNGLDSKKGSFLDSIADRISDVAVFGGIVFSAPFFNHPFLIAAGIVTAASTLLISYIRAKGESVGIKKMAVGIMERAERMLILMVLLFVAVLVPNKGFIDPLNPVFYVKTIPITGFMIGYLILSALCVITVIQRFVYASIQLTKSETPQVVEVEK